MSLWGLNREVYDGNVMLLLLRRNTRSTFAIAVNSFLFLAKVRACSHKHTIHTRTDTDKKTLDFYFYFFPVRRASFFRRFFFFFYLLYYISSEVEPTSPHENSQRNVCACITI